VGDQQRGFIRQRVLRAAGERNATRFPSRPSASLRCRSSPTGSASATVTPTRRAMSGRSCRSRSRSVGENYGTGYPMRALAEAASQIT